MLTTHATATESSVDIYVDAEHGDDGNEGTQRSPLKTLKRATSWLPDIIRGGHKVDVCLAEGDWGNEELVLDHVYVLGRLRVYGISPDRANHRIHSLRASSIGGRLELMRLTATRKDGTGPSFEFQRCGPDVYADRLHAEGWARYDKGVERVIGYLADHGTTLHLRRSSVNHKRYAIRSNYNSRVFSLDNEGENNTFGIGARWGGILHAYGTQPDGDIDPSTDSGAIVIAGQGFKHLTRMNNG